MHVPIEILILDSECWHYQSIDISYILMFFYDILMSYKSFYITDIVCVAGGFVYTKNDYLGKLVKKLVKCFPRKLNLLTKKVFCINSETSFFLHIHNYNE